MIVRSESSPVRILHLITRLIVGGAQENTIFTANLLDRCRFDVDILSGAQTGSEGSLIDEVQDRQIPLIIVPELVRQINPWLDQQALSKITRIMRSRGYSIVHTHSSKAGILGRFAARQAGVPIIIHTVHGWSFHDQMPALSKWAYIWLERWAATHTDILIVVSRHDKEKGLALKIGHPEQYHLVRSSVPFDDFNPERYDRSSIRRELNIPPDAIVIGNVSRFSPQKNLLDWVRTASLVSREYPGTYFLMVGDGPLRNQVEELAEQEGLSGRFLLTGIRRDIPQMMAAMDVFMLTSLWEGLPRAIIQAMCMNLPVVGFRIDGLSEIVRHELTGFLTPPRDLAQMAVYCGYLLENADRRQEMGKEGHALATDEFNLPVMVRKIESLYTKLIEKKN
ncbi:MAG: hypothetical protein A2Z16_14985 [Chloroflexi bacterium RBG_16_54_18]|nr:MAG: hypothetical protein A2Z16_14985 [Chloroflexi bacterium RBG_16_54_18]